MPVYQAAGYLAEQLESILAQTHADFELIAIDDGSTDCFSRDPEEYAKRDPRLLVVHSLTKAWIRAPIWDSRSRAPRSSRAWMPMTCLCRIAWRCRSRL